MRLLVGELGVGLKTTLGNIRSFVLFLFADAHTHDGLNDQPDDQAGAEDPREDGTDAQQLRTLVRNARREAAATQEPKSSRALFKLIRELQVSKLMFMHVRLWLYFQCQLLKILK